MAYRELEDLPVWKAAIDLAVRVFDLAEEGVFRGHPGFRDQIERAVLSISNNIAEGYERGTNQELLTFLYYARGSAGEVRSMLRFMERATAWAELSEHTTSLATLCMNISRQLGAWIASVKNSDYSARHQNDATRRAQESARRQAAFLEELRRVRDKASDPLSPEKSED